MTRILLIDSGPTIFAKEACQLLKKHFEVTLMRYHGKKGILKILFNIPHYDLCFSYFAHDHAAVATFFAKIFRKKSVVYAGGSDVAEEPEIGMVLSTRSKLITKFALRFADIIPTSSESLKRDVNKKFIPGLPEKVKVVYHGVDTDTFRPNRPKEDIAITVGTLSKSSIHRKGIITFVKSAKYLPNTKFVVIGKYKDDSIDYLKQFSSSNVVFTGFVSEEKLLEWYQRAKVYVQVSAHEGFGLALAEAMACECVCVVTKMGAIPEVVGDVGIYVPLNDPKATAEAIKGGMGSELGKKARERIKTMFPLQKREDGLKQTIEDVIRK